MKYLLILVFAFAIVSCSKDDDPKPDNRPLREKIVGDWCNEGCYRFSPAKDSLMIYLSSGDTVNSFKYYISDNDSLIQGYKAPGTTTYSFKNEGKISIVNNQITYKNKVYTKSN